MPHVTDGSWTGQGPLNSVVAPRSSSSFEGAGLYDGYGKALWTTQVNGTIECWRTIGPFTDLVDQDDSVEPFSVISGDQWIGPLGATLHRIGGTVYCLINGKNASIPDMGCYLYRDTSAAADGSGPWVLHSTIHHSGSYGTSHFSGGVGAGEIVVLPDRWATAYQRFYTFSGNTTASHWAVSVSFNQGVTWTQTLDVGWYIVGGPYGYWASRNMGKSKGGLWVWGGNGNVDGPKYRATSDFQSWSDVTGQIGTFVWGGIGGPGGNVGGYSFPISTPNTTWRYANGFVDPGSFGYTHDDVTSGTPTYFQETAYPTSYLGGGGYTDYPPYLCQIGSPDSPMWVWTRGGRVTSNRGWVVGSIGRPPIAGSSDFT